MNFSIFACHAKLDELLLTPRVASDNFACRLSPSEKIFIRGSWGIVVGRRACFEFVANDGTFVFFTFMTFIRIRSNYSIAGCKILWPTFVNIRWNIFARHDRASIFIWASFGGNSIGERAWASISSSAIWKRTLVSSQSFFRTLFPRVQRMPFFTIWTFLSHACTIILTNLSVPTISRIQSRRVDRNGFQITAVVY